LPLLALQGGAVIAAGPEGYCVDPSASNARTGFAMIAGCDAIEGGDARPRLNGLIVVQSGAANTAAVTGAEDAFRAFLESEAGRSLLSRSGDAQTIDLDGTQAGDGRVTVYFDDTAPNEIIGVGPHEWRTFLDLNGRLVTVTVLSFSAAPIGEAAGDALLNQAVDALIAANTPQLAIDG
jgi:hypothetical protein